MPVAMRSIWPFALLVLLAVTFLIKPELRFGLSNEEGTALWAVRDDLRYDVDPRDAARAFLTDTRQWWGRTRTLPQPPLYFALLNTWTIPAGESIYAVRWLSLLGVLIGIAGTVALARRMDKRIRPALIILLASFCTFYAANTAYTYALTFALAALAAWLVVMWGKSGQSRRGIAHGIAYTFILTALLYTHHVALPSVLLHALLLYVAVPKLARRRWWMWCAFVAAAGVALLPYLLLFAPRQLPPLRESLIGLSVAYLPALLVGIGWLIARVERSPQPATRGLLPAAMIAGVFVGGVSLNLLASAAHPNWGAMIQALNRERSPLESGIIVLDEQHPLLHYNRQTDTFWAGGIMINLGWQAQTAESVQDVVGRLGMGRRWAVVDGTHANAEAIRQNLLTLTHFETIDNVDVWHFNAN